MPREARIVRISTFLGIPTATLARMVNLTTGNLLVAADISQITYEVFDVEGTDPNTPIQSGNLTVAVALHELKRDARWGEDQEGYNFDHTISATTFPTAGKTYTLRYLFYTAGDPSPVAALVYSVYVQSTKG